MKILLAIAFLVVPTFANANCAVQLAGPDARTFSDTDFSKFVDQEKRPKLSTSPGTFLVTVNMTCAAGTAQSIQITFDDTDYYILAIQDHQLTSDESRYQTSQLSLSRAAFEEEVANAENIDSLSTQEIQDVVKTLAFFLAESARFSGVEQISSQLMLHSCTAQWLDYATLVRRWSVLSRFSIHKQYGEETSRGGAHNNLLAPITGDVIAGYNDAIAAGHDGPDASYVNTSDWGGSVKVPDATCTPQ